MGTTSRAPKSRHTAFVSSSIVGQPQHRSQPQHLSPSAACWFCCDCRASASYRRSPTLSNAPCHSAPPGADRPLHPPTRPVLVERARIDKERESLTGIVKRDRSKAGVKLSNNERAERGGARRDALGKKMPKNYFKKEHEACFVQLASALK